MYKCYVEKNFSEKSAATIATANEIIDEYQAQGYDLTLRQLYYQFVARDLIENSERSYKRIGSIINDGRLAGLISWDAIVDRTRNLHKQQTWSSPQQILRAAANSYAIDLWKGQEYHPEVWIEKDALIGVIENVCDRNQVEYYACRGYNSQSEQWRAAQRHLAYKEEGQEPVVIYLGDHDPSGIDMSRDLEARFIRLGSETLVDRIALNYDQVEEHDPPPNPTKLTDSRASSYLQKFGRRCWELDALEPSLIDKLIQEAIGALIDPELWAERVTVQEAEKQLIGTIADEWKVSHG